LIPIEGSASPSIRSSGKSDPYAFWMNYYRKHDEPPWKLHETVRLLNQAGKTRDVHAALRAYLTFHAARHAEPWMYEALALAIEMNKGPDADIQTALNYAADLSQKSHNPNDLISAADKLFLKGYLERVGPLVDEAAARVPHNAYPLMMSVNLALKTKDPRRMADTLERLLALGWPGQDEVMRTEARNQAQVLANSLREDGRRAEADTLLANVTNSEARDLFVRLTWDGDADFDLAIDEPMGATASYKAPRTVFGGSVITNGYASHPDEVYVCPRAFDGDYTIRIVPIYSNPAKPTTRVTLETIAHEGTNHEQKQVFNFRPDKIDKPVVVHVTGGRRKTVLPFLDPVAAITQTQPAAKPAAKPRKPGRGRPETPARKPGTEPLQTSKDAVSPH
jgi:hypothetical protein